MKDLQTEIRKFCEIHQLSAPIEHRILDLTSEVGEVAKEILKTTDYGKTEFRTNDQIKLEIGDLFFSLITLANLCDVDLEIALKLAITKYKKRFHERGEIGSDRDERST